MPAHILDTAQILAGKFPQLEKDLSECLGVVEQHLPTETIDFAVAPAQSIYIIPHLGIGAFSPGPNLVIALIDTTNPNSASGVDQHLGRILAHETHHCHRERGPGYGATLAEVMISEGLADHFSEEVFPGPPNKWSVALDAHEMATSLELARAEFHSAKYDHFEWFIGSDAGRVPCWAGYAIGYEAVGKYLEKNPGMRAADLWNMPADTFSSCFF